MDNKATKGVKPFLYDVEIKVPRLFAIPTNLIELSNCCICLQRTFRFSLVDDDDNGKPIHYKFSFL
jgi:hypothetical protein